MLDCESSDAYKLVNHRSRQLDLFAPRRWSAGALYDTLPRLAKPAASDSGFRKFVLSHVNATLDMKDVERIREKANAACPDRLHSFCADLKREADAAIEEDANARQRK